MTTRRPREIEMVGRDDVARAADAVLDAAKRFLLRGPTVRRTSARSAFERELPYVREPATRMTLSRTHRSVPTISPSISRDWVGKARNNLDQIGLSVRARLVEKA
jgi:hypothetical protein